MAYLAHSQERIKPFRIIIKRLVTSTNDIARQWAKPYGVIVADGQTKGRGRLSRQWYSPEGKNIYMTIILPLPEGFFLTGLLPATTALAVREGIATAIPEIAPKLYVKWPNDIYLEMKKLSGILIERISESLFAVGIGINVNMAEDDIPEQIKHKACSLKSVTGRTFQRGRIIESILCHFLQFIQRLLEAPQKIVEQFNRLSLTRQRYVLVKGNTEFRALDLGMAPDGALMVRTEDNRVLRIFSSDLEVLVQ